MGRSWWTGMGMQSLPAGAFGGGGTSERCTAAPVPAMVRSGRVASCGWRHGWQEMAANEHPPGRAAHPRRGCAPPRCLESRGTRRGKMPHPQTAYGWEQQRCGNAWLRVQRRAPAQVAGGGGGGRRRRAAAARAREPAPGFPISAARSMTIGGAAEGARSPGALLRALQRCRRSGQDCGQSGACPEPLGRAGHGEHGCRPLLGGAGTCGLTTGRAEAAGASQTGWEP